VLDDGGYAYYWSYFAKRPRLTIVNLEPPAQDPQGIDWVIADGRQLPFRDGTFDIVFSNSVIEHVGDTASRQSYAREVDRVGQCYYVQTPNYWFPVEPHLMTPLIHFLPMRVQRKLLRNFTLWGILVRPTPEGCDDFLRDIRLLDAGEVRSLFPKAKLWRERFMGITKSLIAVKQPD